MLLLWIQQLAIGLLIPPDVAEIRVHKQIPLMHVAVHALARWYRAGKLVDDRMAALGFGNGRISSETQTLMTVLAPPAGVCGRSIIRVHHMAGRAAARPIVAWVIVRAHEAEKRV